MHTTKLSKSRIYVQQPPCWTACWAWAKARLLASTQDSITDIAQKTGFSNSAYFCKVFKAEKGVSPMAYRKSR